VNVRYSPYFNRCYVKDVRQPPRYGRVYGSPYGCAFCFFLALRMNPSSAPAHGEMLLPHPELRIVLGYIILASFWIICSDMVLDFLHNDPIDTLPLQVYKGLKFVATTAALLWIVLRRNFRRLHLAERRLRDREERFGYKASGRNATSDAAHAHKLLPLPELRIVLFYVLFASIWIIYSDMALDWLTKDPLDSLQLQTFKGLNFVATTAALLFIGLRRSFNRWRRAERSLRESEERFQLAGRAATDAIWDWTIETNAVWWSASFYRLFDWTPDEVVPTTEAWHTRIHPEDKTRTVAAIEGVLRSDQQMWTGEYRFRRKNGSYAFVEDRAYVIRDAEGKAVRVVGGMTDITARKEAEEKLQRSRRQLRALSTRLQSSREEERTRIAREIHDELGQTLTGLKMDLRWAEKHLASESNQALNPILDRIVEAGELVDSTLASVQRIASELRPRVLEDLGLAAAVQHEAQRFQERTGVICRLKTPESLPTLPPEVAMAVFRIFQEALTNVARHAESTEVEVELVFGADGLVLRITDNGKGIQGFNLEDARSLGLLGMKERAQAVGGEVNFKPVSPHGTVVNLALPLLKQKTSALQPST
jgi:two-component system, NarL family, sensor histidine kinase UhpB